MKGVIFDFNGTLFLDNDKHLKAWSKVAMELRGFPLREAELLERINGRPNVLAVRYFNNGKADPALENCWAGKKEEYYRQFCLEDPDTFHLIKGAEGLFDTLKARKIPFTIASASIKENIDFFVESFHLDRWIDPDQIVYDDGTYADKKAMFLQAAQNLKLPVSELTVIEDSLAGLEAALAAGIPDIRIINSAGIASAAAQYESVQQICEDMSQIDLDL